MNPKNQNTAAVAAGPRIVTVTLTAEQARALVAISRLAKMSLPEAVVRCAVVAANLAHDSPGDLRAALWEDGSVPHIRAGRLPSGLLC